MLTSSDWPYSRAYFALFPQIEVCQSQYLPKLLKKIHKYPEFMPTNRCFDEFTEIEWEEGFSYTRGDEDTRPDEYYMFISPKQVKQAGFDSDNSLLLDAYLDCEFKYGVNEDLYSLLFQWVDDLAEVTLPRFGVCQLYGENQYIRKEWQNDKKRNMVWMNDARFCFRTTKRFYLNGPVGLGRRTYFGGDILALFGRDFLLRAPGIVRELPWGGIAIDLCDRPWEKTEVELLDSWVTIMTYLEPAQVMAKPVFAKNKDTVFLVGTDRWKETYKHRIEFEAESEEETSREDYVEQKLVEAGWCSGRKVDIHDMKYALIEDGFTVFPAAEAFLEEFGGLELESNKEEFDSFILNPERFLREVYWTMRTEITNTDRDNIMYYENKIAKEKLCLVGFAYDRYESYTQAVFISESGRFYYYLGYMYEILATEETDFRRVLCDHLYF